MTTIGTEIGKLAAIDIFARASNGDYSTGLHVGRPFSLTYEFARILVADSWKERAGGIPQGSFLLAYYENEPGVSEALLLRVVEPCSLPTDSDVISSMVEYYKDNLKTTGSSSQLDTFTKYEFGFSGLTCRVLGTFYTDDSGKLIFGADVENFYSAHNYQVVKPNGSTLELIVNFKEDGLTGRPSDVNIGFVRYSSSRRFQTKSPGVPVYVRSQDFLGKRTALFGMTRTGKSNTVKKIVQATVTISEQSKNKLSSKVDSSTSIGSVFDPSGIPVFPVGQIIFDINGEYANPNMQDAGTAIYDLYKENTIRYSTVEKEGFKVMKVNFYADILAGFSLVQGHLSADSGDYVSSFTSVDMNKPGDYDSDVSVSTRYDRKVAAYLCCLKEAGFAIPGNFKVNFAAGKEVNEAISEPADFSPKGGVTLDVATTWFRKVWANYNTSTYFKDYERKKGRGWADEDLKAILTFLTRKKDGSKEAVVSGYLKLRDLSQLHTASSDISYSVEIIEQLRKGAIVIVDLSQGDESIQRLYSGRICREIFDDLLNRFVNLKNNNFIQCYFEEAHNLFPKKEEKDLGLIYNRLAKEGAN